MGRESFFLLLKNTENLHMWYWFSVRSVWGNSFWKNGKLAISIVSLEGVICIIPDFKYLKTTRHVCFWFSFVARNQRTVMLLCDNGFRCNIMVQSLSFGRKTSGQLNMLVSLKVQYVKFLIEKRSKNNKTYTIYFVQLCRKQIVTKQICNLTRGYGVFYFAVCNGGISPFWETLSLTHDTSL